jgi:phosphatidate cytidylyltransferase
VIIIASLLLGKFSYGAVFLLAGLIALLEYFAITDNPGTFFQRTLGVVSALLIYLISFLVNANLAGIAWLSVAALCPVMLLISSLYAAPLEGIKSMALILLGVNYVMLPLALMHYLAFPAYNEYRYTHTLVLGILILVWINDTAAYLTGILLGRHRLFPSISPKKSWEGFAGGTLFTLLAAFLLNPLMGALSWYDWLLLAVIVSVFGVFGDLTESLIKRTAGVKDSGTIMPGHGGVLDRFDSVLLVMPVAFVYLLLRGL